MGFGLAWDSHDDDVFDIFEQHFAVHPVNQITRVSAGRNPAGPALAS